MLYKRGHFRHISFIRPSVRQVSGGSMRTIKFRDYLISILIVISAVVIDAKSLKVLRK